MGTTQSVFYPVSLAWDGTTPAGGSIERLDDAVPASIAHTATFGTGSGELIMNPVGNVTNVAVADVNKTGFALNYFGADGMDSLSTAKRFVNAGNWVLIGCHAGLILTTQTFKVRIRIYRLSADGLTRTLIGGPTDSASAATNTLAVNWSVTITMPLVTFETGESFMVAYGMVKNANSILAENANLYVGDAAGAGGNVNTITLPSPGIRTINPRNLDDAGPQITDDLQRSVTFPRALADAGPAPTDDLVRAFTGARELADAGPQITDDLVRAVTFRRALADAGPTPTDDLARQVTFNRSLADAGPSPADDLARAFTGARDLADAGPSPADSLARQVTYARTLEDDLTTGGGGGTTIIKRTIFAILD